MTTITSIYTGNGQTRMTHGPTGHTLTTDLPPDNGGKGTTFSPTDLLAGAFASCVLTIMAKLAERNGEDLAGAKIAIDKIMAENPRRVGEFILHITFPAHFTDEQKRRYQHIVQACPVHNTLSKEVKITIHIQ